MSRKTYAPRLARAALGIRAQDLRTLVRKAWWARRWIAAIEALRLGPRLGRGRQYALSGQVIDLELAGPDVTARVMGSRAEPYRVALRFTTPDAAACARIASRLRAQPALAARLAVDDLPTVVETLFTAEGCPLFPVAGSAPPYDVTMTCSCPDWRKPCKHIAAVLLLLGEEIARRPSALLALRGVDCATLYPEDAPVVRDFAPLPPALLASGATLGDATALVARLGPVPFWRGFNRAPETLTRIYTRIHAALDA